MRIDEMIAVSPLCNPHFALQVPPIFAESRIWFDEVQPEGGTGGGKGHSAKAG